MVWSRRAMDYGTIEFSERPRVNFAKVASIICIFVMLREFRPIEPFLTSYLTSPPVNLTTEEVNETVYPVGTYACCIFAVIIFLMTDYLRYKPIILLDGITGILTYALFLGTPSRLQLILEQIFFGFFYSSDIAANTYLYAKIEDPTQFQKITGYVRASSLVGRFLSGIFGQLVISFGILEKSGLVIASASGMILVTFWSFFIPSVDHSIYFHRVEKRVIQKDDLEFKEISIVKSEKFSVVRELLWEDFGIAYSNLYVLKWSLWWTFSLCGSYFVATYSQVLWQDIANDYGGGKYLMNGAVESISTISSAGSAYLISRTAFDWKSNGNCVLLWGTLALSVLLLFSVESTSLWFVYAAYIAYSTIFQTLLTIAQSEVAKNLKKDSYALIFGINNFVALMLGSCVTYAIIEGHFFRLSTREQFIFYGVYYLFIGAILMTKALFVYVIANPSSGDPPYPPILAGVFCHASA